ncbi:hypothetical protein [Streptomyces huiliensis]|uniref:hypothetical protein n=1 Tax=Streptomyces huiliensis TaxID=2876027 RepID=UPI001CBED4DC|nr:hypothetical protein [Streptomyces huiliensis]MBZ4319558.1 hypothetical protein [Streptomyces huiliensis]
MTPAPPRPPDESPATVGGPALHIPPWTPVEPSAPMPEPVPGCRRCAAHRSLVRLAEVMDEPDVVAGARLLLAQHLNEMHGATWDV